jgi:hypothetical protein
MLHLGLLCMYTCVTKHVHILMGSTRVLGSMPRVGHTNTIILLKGSVDFITSHKIKKMQLTCCLNMQMLNHANLGSTCANIRVVF